MKQEEERDKTSGRGRQANLGVFVSLPFVDETVVHDDSLAGVDVDETVVYDDSSLAWQLKSR
jgi:hypothetical protein